MLCKNRKMSDIKEIKIEITDNKTKKYFNNKNHFYNKKKKETEKKGGRLTYEDSDKKPNVTITDLMQSREILEERLADYDEIDHKDLINVPKRSLLSYITYCPEKQKEMYRTGGYLRVIHNDYVVLANFSGKTFSVQRYIYGDPKNKKDLYYITRFFLKRKNMNGGGEEIKVEMLDENGKKLNPELALKQQEILNSKKKEIEELKLELEKQKTREKNKSDYGNKALKELSKTLPIKNNSDDISIKSSVSQKSSTSSISNKSENSSVSQKSSTSSISNKTEKSSVSNKSNKK